MLIIPGETIELEIKERNRTKVEVAQRLEISLKTLNDLIHGSLAITPLLAQKLEAVFNIDRQFWLNFEQVYQEQKKKLGVPKEKNTRNILHDVVSFKDFSPVTA